MNLVKPLWKRWLKIARIIGNFQSQVILSIFYLVILAPVGLVFRAVADPLNLRRPGRSNFEKWEHEKGDLKSARKQY